MASSGLLDCSHRYLNGREMQRSLIVNADELGLTEGINEGIIEVHAHGIVTSTTMVANFWAFDHAVALSRKYPSLAIGVHLNLTHGMPILPQDRVHTLVDEHGYFFRRRPFLQRIVLGQIGMIQVYEEFRAQIDKVIAAGSSRATSTATRASTCTPTSSSRSWYPLPGSTSCRSASSRSGWITRCSRIA